MSIEQTLADIQAKVTEQGETIALLKELLVVSQQEAARAADVSERTITRKAKAGKVKRLSKDGSRRQYLKLAEIPKLKER